MCFLLSHWLTVEKWAGLHCLRATCVTAPFSRRHNGIFLFIAVTALYKHAISGVLIHHIRELVCDWGLRPKGQAQPAHISYSPVPLSCERVRRKKEAWRGRECGKSTTPSFCQPTQIFSWETLLHCNFDWHSSMSRILPCRLASLQTKPWEQKRTHTYKTKYMGRCTGCQTWSGRTNNPIR